MHPLFSAPLPSLFFEPRRFRPHGVGYWSGHIPFACDLVHTLRPQIMVELGTHTGESYFAMCQAIEESGCETQAFAVDTWRGDQHTGAYSEVVFEEVCNVNQAYPFSTLLRKTFDEAWPDFAPGSVDLLHIDGAHVYEAIKHDWDMWWPKVSEGGVAILHDSNERGHDFGVWRLLDELRQNHPAEQFLHSHGLAVIAKPPLKEHAAAAFVTADTARLAAMRRYYETCAAAMRTRYFAAHRARSDWEVIAQLFWRGHKEAFTEAASVRAAEVVGVDGLEILLPIPSRTPPIVEVRIHPSLDPACLRTDTVRFADYAGKTLQQKRVGKVGLHPIELRAPKGLERGGALYLTLTGLDPLSPT